MQKTPTVTIPESKVVKYIFHNLLTCGLGQNLIAFFCVILRKFPVGFFFALYWLSLLAEELITLRQNYRMKM